RRTRRCRQGWRFPFSAVAGQRQSGVSGRYRNQAWLKVVGVDVQEKSQKDPLHQGRSAVAKLQGFFWLSSCAGMISSQASRQAPGGPGRQKITVLLAMPAVASD